MINVELTLEESKTLNMAISQLLNVPMTDTSDQSKIDMLIDIKYKLCKAIKL